MLAEDEESCVVFGMPKEAIATGKVDTIVPLPLMCREILRRCRSHRLKSILAGYFSAGIAIIHRFLPRLAPSEPVAGA